MARKEDFDALTNTQNKNRQEELRAKIRRIENGGNILKILGKALIATKMPQGATAVKENLDVEDAETKEMTDRSMDILDRVAVPKIVERRRKLAQEKQYAQILTDTYDVSDEAIRAVAAGGFGQLEGFVSYIENLNKARGNKGKLSGDQISTLVDNANSYRSDSPVMEFLDKKFKLTKDLLEEHPDQPDAAIFSSLIGTPRDRSRAKLSNISVLGNLNAFDLVRMSKSGQLDDTTHNINDTVFTRNLEQEEKFISGTYFERVNKPLETTLFNRVSNANAGSIMEGSVANKNDPIYNMLAMKYNWTPEYDPTTGKVNLDNASDVIKETHKKILDEYGSIRSNFANELSVGSKREYMDTITQDILNVLNSRGFPDKKQLIDFINFVDPLQSESIFKDYDEFKIIDSNTGDAVSITYAQIKQEMYT